MFATFVSSASMLFTKLLVALSTKVVQVVPDISTALRPPTFIAPPFKFSSYYFQKEKLNTYVFINKLPYIIIPSKWSISC